MQSIRTEKLTLRPFVMDDIETVHSYISDGENAKYLLFATDSRDDTKAFIEKAIEDYSEVPLRNYNYAIELNENSKHIGGCSIMIDADGSEAEVGWVIRKEYWGRGLGTLIAQMLIKHGFEQLGLRRIYAACDSENVGSYRVMEKNGMRREGYFVKSRLSRGQYKDELYYAILREEWEGAE
ncbi:MAG: GNAT family N-acetyltransferase [Clostridia bacterium]|jgi:[ribosomal protein S5]-alanine N-acetyltransferase|nr:GNAT family N-acetyltransferase [Clostridia bacterium]MBT7122223.1 GNAT family N-acetyltransferase [Clostridia bacterium]